MNGDDQKQMGRLEKGQEFLESSFQELRREQGECSSKTIALISEMRQDFKMEMVAMREGMERQNNSLHTKIDTTMADQVKLRLSVQKLATTVSIVVGVSITLLKSVWDVARDAFASTFMHQ